MACRSVCVQVSPDGSASEIYSQRSCQSMWRNSSLGPPHWKALSEDHGIVEALMSGDLGTWLGALDYQLQLAFESPIMAVLFLLQDTGIDTRAKTFSIGCIQPGLPFQCFKVPCRGENFWARMIADSEDIATFAYMTTECLQATTIKCRGLGASWRDSTALFSTAVFCHQKSSDAVRGQISLSSAPAGPPTATHKQTQAQTQARMQTHQWSLKHCEAYHIGPVNSPLLAQVDQPVAGEEPRLLVSKSTIGPEFLLRLYRKPMKARRLREKRTFNQEAEESSFL
jgi:hypothetical protein